MNAATQRLIARWIHMIVSIPIFGYIFSPFDKLPGYARPTASSFSPSWY